MERKSAAILILLASIAIFTSTVKAQNKVIGEKGVLADKRTVVVINDGFISFLSPESIASIFGEEVSLEVMGSDDIASIIGEKGSDKIIGEKVIGEKVIGEKGSEKVIGEKVIGEKGSEKVIREKGLLVRGIRTGRTVRFLGTGYDDTAVLTKLNIGNRLSISVTPRAPSGPRYTLDEPALTNPCCAVVKVTSDGNVLAENPATRDSFYFNVPDPKIRRSLHVGQLVGTDRERRWAFIRSAAVTGLRGLPATFSFPIRRDSERRSVAAGGPRY
jgi:hypothetical protein